MRNIKGLSGGGAECCELQCGFSTQSLKMVNCPAQRCILQVLSKTSWERLDGDLLLCHITCSASFHAAFPSSESWLLLQGHWGQICKGWKARVGSALQSWEGTVGFKAEKHKWKPSTAVVCSSRLSPWAITFPGCGKLRVGAINHLPGLPC